MKNNLNLSLNYDNVQKYNDSLKEISHKMEGRMCIDKHTHILLLIKELMGEKCKTYCEIGSLYGGSIIALLQDETKCDFIGIDFFDGYYGQEIDPSIGMKPCKEIVLRNIENFNLHNHKVTLIQGSSYAEETVNEFKKLNVKLDLLFIDGDHSKEGVLKDFEKYQEYLSKDGIIIFDNYEDYPHWPEVKEAVDSIDFDKYNFTKLGQYGKSFLIKRK